MSESEKTTGDNLGSDGEGKDSDDAQPAKRRKLEEKEISIDLNDKKFV